MLILVWKLKRTAIKDTKLVECAHFLPEIDPHKKLCQGWGSHDDGTS